MSLNKKKMVREIGRRTRLSNRNVERVIETLVDVWTEELVTGGRIEIENFIVLDTATSHRVKRRETHESWYTSRRIRIRVSKKLRAMLLLSPSE